MPRQGRIANEWKTRTKEIDFLKNNGGFYAVVLTLDLEQARKLLRDVRACVNTATTYEKDDVEIIAHWGKRGGDVNKGYLLRTRVKRD